MILKGLEQYDINDENGEIRVYGQRFRKVIPRNRVTGRWCLWTHAKPKQFTEGQLRFLMRHPEIDARDVRPREMHIRFLPDGTVISSCSEKRKSRYSLFRGIGDVMRTCGILLEVQSGNYTRLLEFIKDARPHVIHTVAKLAATTYNKVSNAIDEGEEMFIKQVEQARMERLMPLFAWYCRCVKVVVLLNSNKISIEEKGLDRTRILSVSTET